MKDKYKDETDYCPECKVLLEQHPTIKTLWRCPKCDETFEDFSELNDDNRI